MARSQAETNEHTRSGSEPQASIPLRWSIALNLAIVLAAGLGAGVLQANASQLAFPAPQAALPLFGAGIVGALSALAVRLLLRTWKGVFRFLFAFAVLLAWIVVSHSTYVAWMRQPLRTYFINANIWILDGQLAVGCLAILAAGLTGRRVHRSAPLEHVYRLFRREPPAVEGKAPLHWSLMLGTGMALVLGVGIGTLQANTNRMAVPVPPLAITLLGAVIVGFLAGATVLLTLPGWTEVLRIMFALLLVLIWLIAVESTYADWMGLKRVEYLAGADNWAEIGLLAAGCMGGIASGLGRRTIPVEIGQASLRGREPASRPKKRADTSQRARVKEKRQAVSLPKPKLSILRRRPEPVEENGSIRVTGMAEERCPYCLDVVEKKDPRGVVVCDICGSPHHADCWEAGGGMCQVPHLIT